MAGLFAKIENDMREMGIEMELHELLGSRVHVHVPDPEFWFQGVLMATPQGDYEVVRVKIGGAAGESHEFEFRRVWSVDGSLITLLPESDEQEKAPGELACPDCYEDRINFLVWRDDDELQCLSCGLTYCA